MYFRRLNPMYKELISKLQKHGNQYRLICCNKWSTYKLVFLKQKKALTKTWFDLHNKLAKILFQIWIKKFQRLKHLFRIKIFWLLTSKWVKQSNNCKLLTKWLKNLKKKLKNFLSMNLSLICPKQSLKI